MAVLALVHDDAFAAQAASASLLGLISLAAFVVARVSGLLAPSPIITSVLAAFTQAQAGPDTTLRLLRGMLTGFFSFALFCWTIAVLLPHAALGVTFAAAIGVAVLTQVAIARGRSIGSRPYSR